MHDSPSASQVAVLHRISNIVSSKLSLDEVLGQVIGLAVQTTACDACLVYLVDAAAGRKH
jgi:uroporphyrinogen-III synthase